MRKEWDWIPIKDTASFLCCQVEDGEEYGDRTIIFHITGYTSLYRVPVADVWITASALRAQATLVHKDPEFEQVAHLVPMPTLSYKEGD